MAMVIEGLGELVQSVSGMEGIHLDGAPVLDLGGDTFRADRVGKVHHNLAHHPLMSLEGLKNLVVHVPAVVPRHYRGAAHVSESFQGIAEAARQVRAPAQMLETQAHGTGWLLLENVERDAKFRALVMAYLGRVRPIVDEVDPGMGDWEAWISVAAPGAIVPYHMDHACTFHLQIEGTQTLMTWNGSDRTIVDDETLEHFHGAWSHEKVVARPGCEGRAETMTLRSGDGAFLPMAYPYACRVGDHLSITLGLTFQTKETHRQIHTYAANHALRRLGLEPGPVGRHRLVDNVKDGLFRGMEVLRKLRKAM